MAEDTGGMGMSDQCGWTPQEIRAMAHAAYIARSVHPAIGLDRQTAEVLWAGMPDDLHGVWDTVARAVLQKNRELALERLARDLADPNSTASKLQEELRAMTCPHCGKRLEEEPEERDRRGPV